MGLANSAALAYRRQRWLWKLKTKQAFWPDLPADLQEDVDFFRLFACSIMSRKSFNSTIARVTHFVFMDQDFFLRDALRAQRELFQQDLRGPFQSSPALCEQKELWEFIIFRKPALTKLMKGSYLFNPQSCLVSLMEDFAPRWLFADRKMMSGAFDIDTNVLLLADLSLRADARFLRSILASGDIWETNYKIQCSTVDLFGKIDVGSASRLFKEVLSWREHVPDRKGYCWRRYTRKGGYFYHWNFTLFLWQWQFVRRRSIIMAWLEAGMPLSYDLTYLSGDQEVFLTIARYSHPRWKMRSFRLSNHALRDDITFMKQVVSIDPVLLLCASRRLMRDKTWVVHLVNIVPTITLTFYRETEPATLGELHEHVDMFVRTLQAYSGLQCWTKRQFQGFHTNLWGSIYEYIGLSLPKELESYVDFGYI